jgi:hypothetical protein
MKEKSYIIIETIQNHYLPGTISNYDLIIKMSDLTDLFAPVLKITAFDISLALPMLNFLEESKIDDGYFVKICL